MATPRDPKLYVIVCSPRFAKPLLFVCGSSRTAKPDERLIVPDVATQRALLLLSTDWRELKSRIKRIVRAAILAGAVTPELRSALLFEPLVRKHPRLPKLKTIDDEHEPPLARWARLAYAAWRRDMQNAEDADGAIVAQCVARADAEARAAAAAEQRQTQEATPCHQS